MLTINPTSNIRSRLILVLASVTGVLVTVALVTASMWPVLSAVTTGHTPEYPDVLPQYFSADPPRVFEESVRAVEALDRFSIVQKNEHTGRIEATHEGLLGFVEDVTITVVPQTDFVTSVEASSQSRVGRGDFGQNARNIRTFQAELDRRLGAVRFNPYESGTQK